MVIGIQALNIRGTGGLTHLKEVIRAMKLTNDTQIVIWVNESVKRNFYSNDSQITIVPVQNINNILKRFIWLKFVFPKEVLKCDILFVPGGITGAKVTVPIVSMSQNLLLYEKKERIRHGIGIARLRLELLRYIQKRDFLRADSIIVLTNYAKKVIHEDSHIPLEKMIVIPHGIEDASRAAPRAQKEISQYSINNPLKILYVSTVNAYKHQGKVIDAVSKLRNEGYPVSLTLIGGGYEPYLKDMLKKISELDEGGNYLHYIGLISHNEITGYYHSHDLFVYASSCENLPIILLEAMAASMPIACSNMGPMPEVLEAAGEYFDPESSDSIYKATLKLLLSKKYREKYSLEVYEKTKKYNWGIAAENTFNTIISTLKKHNEKT